MIPAPEYLAALAQEKVVWSAAWQPVNESICGIEVVPLTPRRLMLLELCDSPWIVGGLPAVEHVCAFLWALHPRYGPTARLRRWWFYRRLRRSRVPFLDFLDGIHAYLAEAFGDSPAAAPATDRQSYALIVAYAHALCEPYNLAPDEIADMPLKQIFQLLKPLIKQSGRPVCNPSDAVRAKCRAKQNEERKNGHS